MTPTLQHSGPPPDSRTSVYECARVCVRDDKDGVTFKVPRCQLTIQTRLCISTCPLPPPASLCLSFLSPASLLGAAFTTSSPLALPPPLAIWNALQALSFLTTDIPEGFPPLTDFTSTLCSSFLVHAVVHSQLIFCHFSPRFLFNLSISSSPLLFPYV